MTSVIVWILFYFNEKLRFCIVVPCLSRSENFLFAGLSCCSVLALPIFVYSRPSGRRSRFVLLLVYQSDLSRSLPGHRPVR
jgi:hypothetical protein